MQMNDPHVVALWYRLEHGDSVDYGEAQPLDHIETGFRVKAEQGQVCFEFKDHYATEDAAREAIAGYIRVWEFEAGLLGGPHAFKLTFDRAQITDRKPPPPVPGVVNVSAHIRAGAPTITVKVQVVNKTHYPPPPSGLMLTPDVQTMYDRFQGYRLDREPLGSMAYFCVTILETSAGQACKKGDQVRKAAAKTYGIQLKVLDKIATLSYKKGGQQARKASGKDNNLTAQESRFMEEAIKAIIRRAAEKAHAPDSDLPKISLSDLPPI